MIVRIVQPPGCSANARRMDGMGGCLLPEVGQRPLSLTLAVT